MPTTNPRLAITLTPRSRAAIGRIAAHTREPASRVIAGILEEAAPTLEQIAATMDALKAQTQGYRNALGRKIDAAERRAFKAAAESLAILAEMEQEAREAGSGSGRGTRPPRRRVRTPDPVTRG